VQTDRSPTALAESERLFELDIAKNRSEKKWTRAELFGRVLWALVLPLFRFSPRLFWGWRVLLLQAFGARVGQHVRIDPSVRIFLPWNLRIGDWSSIGFDVLVYNLGVVSIGKNVTISQRAHLCAGSHDYRTPAMTLLKPPISVSDDVWVCADAYVGPGVSIGSAAIVAARAVVIKDVAAGTIVGGNPAVPVGDRVKPRLG
jgi:putative colanic acid biosynthesis acetyltransferase WcaF